MLKRACLHPAGVTRTVGFGLIVFGLVGYVFAGVYYKFF